MVLTKNDIDEIKKIIEPMAIDLKDVKKRVKKIEVNVESMLGFLDEQDVKLHGRVSKIEKHLDLPQN